VVSAMPLPRLSLTIDGTVGSRVQHRIAPEVQFQGITGSDGQPASTLEASAFDTREMTLDALGSFAVSERWRVGVTASNVLDRRAHRPGSVLIPYLAEGRRVMFSLTYSR